jgi:2-phosphosulfolactate phosphatase
MSTEGPLVEVLSGPGGLTPDQLEGRFCIVVDVLRASTTIAVALDAGARGVIPVASVETATRLAHSLGKESTLLAGETRSVRVEGFDLGNSPSEFVPSVVDGKTIVLCTTNGARALASLAGVRDCATAAFVNLSACAARAAREPRITIICAGSGMQFALEDFACAGALVEAIERDVSGIPLDDGARTARDVWERRDGDLATFLRATDHGRELTELGLGADVDLAAQVDLLATVPMLRDGRLGVEPLAETAGSAR